MIVPSEEENERPARPTGRERMYRWLENQGVSTILLLGIAYGVWTHGPALVAQIQDGYDRNAKELREYQDRQEKTVDQIMTRMEKNVDRLISYMESRRD